MDPFLDAASHILNFGTIGLALLLAFLAYRLLAKLVDATRETATRVVITLWIFMALCVVLTCAGVYLEHARLGKPTGTWGSMEGDYAQRSFLSGGHANVLTGHWVATYYLQDSAGKPIPYQYKDPKTGKMVDYPPESIDLIASESVVSGKTTLSSGEHVSSWGEGRLSASNDLALIYWSPSDGTEATMSGVNYLQLTENFQEGLSMRGTWIGRNRDGSVTVGTTEWKKQ